MDLNDTLEIEREAQREARREALVNAIKVGSPAKAAFEKATREAREEQGKVEAAYAAGKAKVKRLFKQAEEHRLGYELAVQAYDDLVAEFVPRDLVTERDKAHSAAIRAKRALDDATWEVARLQKIIDQRSPKTITGVKRGKDGRPMMDPASDPANPTPIMTEVPNPRRYHTEEDKLYDQQRLDKAVLVASELGAKADALEKVLREAQQRLDDAVEEAKGA